MENTEQQVLAVKELQPHAKDINPSKHHITVVRSCYCQSLKRWSVRVVDETGDCLFAYTDADKLEIEKEWVYLMKKYHNIDNAVWQKEI